MKKIKLLNVAILLFAVFAFTGCEESGEIQFVVKDDFPTEIAVNGLEGETSYSLSETADISELLDGVARFVEADVETVTLQLKDYSGTSIVGNVTVKSGTSTLFSENVTLSTTPTVITIAESDSDILSDISSGMMPISLDGVATQPIEDNNFTIIATVRVRGTVE